MAQIFEVMMVVSFGVSWPASIAKSLKARTTKGKSLFFLFAIWFGYICGTTSKIIAGNINYVVIFYIINLVMVSIDLMLYFRNLRLDRENSMP